MKFIFAVVIFIASSTAYAETSEQKQKAPEQLKIVSTTTEPMELPDPIDEPPVLQYDKTPKAAAPQEATRIPAATAPTPERYIDNELGVVCYFLQPPQIQNIVSTSAPAISCLKLPVKEKPLPALPQSN